MPSATSRRTLRRSYAFGPRIEGQKIRVSDNGVEVGAETDSGSVLALERKQGKKLVVKYIQSVNKGDGTRLYEFALRFAKRNGLKLASDSTRSVFAEAFWRKQAGKGRATCLTRPHPASYWHSPLRDFKELMNERLAAGEITRAEYAAAFARLPRPNKYPPVQPWDRYAVYGSDNPSYGWPCNTYTVDPKRVRRLNGLAAFLSGLLGIGG